MALDIDSTLTSNPQFRKLRLRLLLSFLGVLVAILGAGMAAAYQAVVYGLNRQMDDHLLSLASSSAHTMDIVKHEYEELESNEHYRPYGNRNSDGALLPMTLAQLMEKYEGTVSSIFPDNFHYAPQGVEWYDETRRLLIREGSLFADWALPETIAPAGVTVTQQGIRTFTLPTYILKQNGEPLMTGYIRVSHSSASLETELRYLGWSLGLGYVVALGLTAIGGTWLTAQSLKPIASSFEQLKQFTADAAHELRSPLTIIKASIALVQNHPERVHPADAQKLATAASACDQMARLVEDLLLLARLDGKTATMAQEWRAVPIDEVLEDMMEMADIEASQRKINLKSHLLPEISVLGDAEQLKRLFTNLLGNALQYTPEGGTVTVAMKRLSEEIVVSVQDTGIGISPEHLPLIFDRFWRADQARTHREEGTGMGLAIARTIAQAHGGDIAVSSQLGKGSNFQVQLPVTPSL